MDSPEQRLDFNSNDNEEEAEETEASNTIPPSVFDPKTPRHYEAMSRYLEDSSMSAVDFLVESHGQNIPSRRMAEVWGAWLTLQQNILIYEAEQNDWHENESNADGIKESIVAGMKELASHFSDKEGMAEFLEMAKGLTVKGWEKARTDYVKEIIVKKR